LPNPQQFERALLGFHQAASVQGMGAAPSNRYMASLGAISIVTSDAGDDFIFGN
jgi:hypothetical protein